MPVTIGKSFNPAQLRILHRVGERISGLGVNFAACDVDGEIVLICSGGRFESCPQQLSELGRRIVSEHAGKRADADTSEAIWRLGDDNVVFGAVLMLAEPSGGGSRPAGAVLLDVGGDKPGQPCQGAGNSAYWSEMLRLVVENYRASKRADEQIEKVGTELAHTYEELVLLHKLSTNMRITEQDAGFLQMACDSLTEIIQVEGIAVLLEKTVDNGEELVLAAGSGLIDLDKQTAAILHSRLVEELQSGKEALLDSDAYGPFKYDWPGNVKNIIAVPLCVKDKSGSQSARRTRERIRIIGMMVAINRVDKPDFDSTDVKLFNSVASSCAVFLENGRLFKDLKELLIGSLKALTSSIDAKDEYTRGHSERVAFISRWIAERLSEVESLGEEQLHRVYLAGLLHDIGKIGVDEAVLRKRGKLTAEEYECIKKHPSIGAAILRDIKQMRDIVPGVLCHHERVDGKGYPNGLRGGQLPLIGKIVQLADSFDAMTSKRTYRDARSIDEAMDEIERGLGTQFDEKIGRVFLNSDVHALWDILQEGPAFAGVHGSEAFSEYGTAAVGTLIR